ncbi:uncharacterized protein [Euwallacea fornicatus]|uniref:uncharacterized protein n=1 Tax=Euwallacea fornicatus TaxID=995702 RepID=UPI00338F704C
MRGAVLLLCYFTATAIGAPADLTAPDPPADDITSTLQQTVSVADKTVTPALTFSNLSKILPQMLLAQQPSSVLSKVFNNSSSSTIEGLTPLAEFPDFLVSVVKEPGAADAGKVFWVPSFNKFGTRQQP